MTEKVLLNSGYKLFEMEHPKSCDKFYQKNLKQKEDDLEKHINVYFYYGNGYSDKYEFELYEEKENYAISTHIFALNNDYPYTIEEIEKELLEG